MSSLKQELLPLIPLFWYWPITCYAFPVLFFLPSNSTCNKMFFKLNATLRKDQVGWCSDLVFCVWGFGWCSDGQCILPSILLCFFCNALLFFVSAGQCHLFPILPLLHSLFYIILEKIKSLTLCCKLAYFILYIDIEHFCGRNLLPH